MDIFETAYYFPLVRVAAGLTPLRRTVTKRYGFRELIHWLRVDERPTRVKIYAVS